MSYATNLPPSKKFSNNNKGSDPTQPQGLPQQESIPHTILVDCNRANANNTKNGANTLNKWTCEFAGGIQLKSGDQISVNSAFLNSIGVGDLIAWTKDGTLQDNKCRWLIEYYCSNDGKNDKREGYNLIKGSGKYPYPYDNKPCELYRQQQKFTFRPQQNARMQSGTDYSYTIDPYIGGRFFGLRNVVAPTSFDVGITITVGLYYKPFGGADTYTDNPFSLMRFGYYNDAEALVNLDARKVVAVGNYFKVNAVLDANAPVADRTNLNNDIINYKYMCYGHFLHTDGIYYAMVERPFFWNTTNTQTVGNIPDRSITAKIKICGSRGKCAIINNDLSANIYAKPFNYIDNDCFTSLGDSYYLITNRGGQLQNIGGTPTQQKTNNINNGVIDRQHGFNTNLALGVNCVEDQSPLYQYQLTIHHLAHTVGGQIFTDAIEFTIGQRYNADVINLTSVAELVALNSGLYNFTFNIARPDGTQELIVAYTNNQNPKVGGAINITYVSPNRFRIVGGVYRDAEDKTKILDQTTANTTPSGNNDTNTLILHGYEDTITFDFDTTGETTQQYLSTCPYNLAPVAPTANAYPLQNEINPILYGLVKINQNFANLQNNDNMGYNGINYNNDQYITNHFGYVLTEDTTGNITPNPFIILAPISQLSVGVKHYDFKDFIINDEYSSPSDIATTLTTQAHEIENARDRYGTVIENSKGKGLLQSKFLLPVWTTFADDNLEPTRNTTGQTTLSGSFMLGSYYLQKQIFNYPKDRFTTANNPTYLPNGKYHIYFRTKHTTINKPYLPNGAETPANLQQDGNKDFDVSNPNNLGDAGIPRAKSINGSGEITGYPLQYIEGKECYISQFVGADTLTFNWNDTDSRFALSYMSQIAVDNFNTSTGSGGDMSVSIYIPNPVGQNNYNYKAPHSRYGGVNIVNWCSEEIPAGITPYQVYTTYNIDRNTYNLDAEHDAVEWFLDTTANRNPIGNRFWNKLGFSDTQLFTKNVGSSVDTVSGEYIPNGTTDILIDSAGGIITGGEPNENTPFGNTLNDWDKNQTNHTFGAGTRFGALGGLEFTNHNVGYGIPSTAGRPLQFIPNHDRTQIDANNKFFSYDSTYNPDREEHTGYTYKTDTALLEAETLPIKTEDSYFYIVSDLVKSDFFVSNENGFNANVIGILSKLNSGGDFIYQYQAPQQFYAKRDAIITSITTEIVTTKFGIPPAIDPFSSVIYQITRMNPQPEPLQDPRFLEQNQYFSSIQQHIQMLLQQHKNAKQQSKTQRIQEIIREVSGALVVPNDNQADIIQRIQNNYQRLGLARFRGNQREYQQFLLQNPEAQNFINDLATYNRLQNRMPQAPTGITDIESITPESIEATMLNTTPQNNPHDTPIFLPPDQHALATHIIDTIHEAHQGGQQFTQTDLMKLITSTQGINTMTAESIAQLGAMYQQSQQELPQIGRAETPTGYDPNEDMGGNFGGGRAEQPTEIPAIPVGLDSLTNVGVSELDQMLLNQPASVFGLEPITNETIARMRRNIKSSSGSTSGLGGSSVSSGREIEDDEDTITGDSEETKQTSSSGYYSADNRNIPPTTASSSLGRIDEAEGN